MESLTVPTEIGVLPLRNSVLFPHAIMPISVGRRKTLNLLDDVVGDNKLIAVVSQRNPADDDPDPSEMYRVGTAARGPYLRRAGDGQEQTGDEECSMGARGHGFLRIAVPRREGEGRREPGGGRAPFLMRSPDERLA